MRLQDVFIFILAALILVTAVWYVVAQVPEDPISACGVECVMRAAEGK